MSQSFPLLETTQAPVETPGSYLVASLGPAFLTGDGVRVRHPVEIVFVQQVDQPAFAVNLWLPSDSVPAAIFGPFPRYELARETVNVALLHYDPTWLADHLKATNYRNTPGATCEIIRDVLGPVRTSTHPTWSEHVAESFLHNIHAVIRAQAIRSNRGY